MLCFSMIRPFAVPGFSRQPAEAPLCLSRRNTVPGSRSPARSLRSARISPTLSARPSIVFNELRSLQRMPRNQSIVSNHLRTLCIVNFLTTSLKSGAFALFRKNQRVVLIRPQGAFYFQQLARSYEFELNRISGRRTAFNAQRWCQATPGLCSCDRECVQFASLGDARVERSS
jgi:hypothetical protein